MRRIFQTVFLCLFYNLIIKSFKFSNHQKLVRVCRYRLKCNNKEYQLRDDKEMIPFLTIRDIEIYANQSGISIQTKVIGPYLRLEAINSNDQQIIGYLTAFIRPGVFHLETIQVENRRQILGYKRKGWKADGPGISFILGTWALRWAYEKGCTKSQLLAVDDSPKMLRTLTRLYQSFGFRLLRYVDDDILDRIVWGASGNLMEIDIPKFLNEWTPKLKSFTK